MVQKQLIILIACLGVSYTVNAEDSNLDNQLNTTKICMFEGKAYPKSSTIEVKGETLTCTYDTNRSWVSAKTQGVEWVNIDEVASIEE